MGFFNFFKKKLASAKESKKVIYVPIVMKALDLSESSFVTTVGISSPVRIAIEK